MAKWVEWIEPFGVNNEPVYLRVSEDTAIAVSKKLTAEHGITITDAEALDDFLCVHWADHGETTDTPSSPPDYDRRGFEAFIRRTMRPTSAYDLLERAPSDPSDYLNLYVHYQWFGWKEARS